MSFSVQHLPTGLEYSGSSLNHLFAQRRNLLSGRFLRMLLQINRFNRECGEVLTDGPYSGMTLSAYVTAKEFGDDFLFRYLLPMSSAVWSATPDAMLAFPAATLVRFFTNHGFLGLTTQHQWWTVVNGSQSYRDRLIAPFRSRIRVGVPAVKVRRLARGVAVTSDDGEVRKFDKVIFASHADETLNLLADPTALERRLLSKFSYQKNTATLHTDRRVMPKTRLAWSSWNYRLDVGPDGRPVPSTIYWMNSLQQVSEKKDYFISIGDSSSVDRSHVLREFVYTHPQFTLESAAAQKELPRLNENGTSYFCGSYFRYGFHEDALTSAIDCCRALKGSKVWD